MKNFQLLYFEINSISYFLLVTTGAKEYEKMKGHMKMKEGKEQKVTLSEA